MFIIYKKEQFSEPFKGLVREVECRAFQQTIYLKLHDK